MARVSDELVVTGAKPFGMSIGYGRTSREFYGSGGRGKEDERRNERERAVAVARDEKIDGLVLRAALAARPKTTLYRNILTLEHSRTLID